MKQWRDYFLPWDQLKLAHKLWSVRFAVLGAVLQAVYYAGDGWGTYITPRDFIGCMVFLSLAILVSRVMNQSGIDF